MQYVLTQQEYAELKNKTTEEAQKLMSEFVDGLFPLCNPANPKNQLVYAERYSHTHVCKDGQFNTMGLRVSALVDYVAAFKKKYNLK